MAPLRDLRGCEVPEGRHVAVEISKFAFGKVLPTKPIIERGPFQGGTLVTILVPIEIPLPPGHFQLPVFLIEDPDKKEGKSPLAP